MPYKAWSPPRRAGCSPSVSDPRLHLVDGVPAYVSPGNNPTCMMAPPSELNGEPAGDLYGYPILPEAHKLNPPGDWPSSARDVIPDNTTYSFMPGTHATASSSRPKRQVHHPGQNGSSTQEQYPSSGTMNMRGSTPSIRSPPGAGSCGGSSIPKHHHVRFAPGVTSDFEGSCSDTSATDSLHSDSESIESGEYPVQPDMHMGV